MKKFIFTLVAGLIFFYPQTPSLAEECGGNLGNPYTRAACTSDPYTR